MPIAISGTHLSRIVEGRKIGGTRNCCQSPQVQCGERNVHSQGSYLVLHVQIDEGGRDSIERVQLETVVGWWRTSCADATETPKNASATPASSE